ncbi:origin recognition complex subunit [Paraphoma chrysanthemicola]|uniref:Origin recognition complex subunit n=1 Tax=Paraphoma chrysanthemicola TaxID=798071 RepID=A0A8K0VXJ1_9PLEO|nr:origin recognition complex subunit [Paraphoma chrysanthemicola]
MEHQRCYIYEPQQNEERASKRQRTSKYDPHAQLHERLQTYRTLWSLQEERIQSTLEGADSAVQQKIVDFVSSASEAPDELKFAIPTGLVVAGPSIASHGPFFARLGQRIRKETKSTYVVLTSAESNNLKTLLKNLIKKVTSLVEDDDDDELDRPSTSSRYGPKLLNYDLGHIQEWRKKNRVSSIVVAIQDSEAFDAGLLGDVVDLFHSWLDRLPFVLLFGIATSAESFEDRLSAMSLRYLEGEKFDVTQSDDIIEKLFSATVANTDARLHIGPSLCRRMLDRQKDHVQNVQDFCDGLKYAYMSHFYASIPSLLMQDGIESKDLSADTIQALRTLPSLRRSVEDMLEKRRASDVRKLLESDEQLLRTFKKDIELSQQALSRLSFASQVLFKIRASLQMTPSVKLSSIWIRAASADMAGSPILRETMLSIKKIPSDKFVELLADITDLQGDYLSVDVGLLQQELNSLIDKQDGSAPLRTRHDVRNDSLRTTVVAQKVLLSKHKAALSEQDKAYSDLVGSFHDKLEAYFESAFVDPSILPLSEVLIYDLKSPHTEVFQPKPRFAIERALAAPHDYLGCECCSGVDGAEAALNATQPATAIVYQMYLESGSLMNVSDLWSAFNAIAGEGDEDEESKTMALFQRALAELKYLGMLKPSRKKTDHVSKTMWKGL